jgi:hypothetical protein
VRSSCHWWRLQVQAQTNKPSGVTLGPMRRTVVVGDHDDAALEHLDGVGQRAQRVAVQVVGRLILFIGRIYNEPSACYAEQLQQHDRSLVASSTPAASYDNAEYALTQGRKRTSTSRCGQFHMAAASTTFTFCPPAQGCEKALAHAQMPCTVCHNQQAHACLSD